MKIFKLTVTPVLIALVFLICSCKKENGFNLCGYNQPNQECLVTHTEDDLFGFSLDIFYNEKGNPDSMNFEGFPATMQYDNRSRLTKVNFGSDGVHFDFIYKDNTFLPSVLNYYYPAFGGLISVDSFQYNFVGQLKKIGITNLLLPQYNLSEIYNYDNNHNVTRVIWGAQNGGTVFIPDFTAYEVLKYDHHINFMSGNQWIKYILMHSELDSYTFMMFSVNNAQDWHWGYPGGFDQVTSTFEYDNKGFANRVHFHVFDTDFTRTSFSTCDNAEQNRQIQSPPASPSAKFKLMPKTQTHIPVSFNSN